MPMVPPRFATSVLSKLPEPVRRRASSATGRRMLRFAPAAATALAASQVIYFLCGSVWHLTGRVTGAAAWLAGALVSYLVSRWAWERRGRPRLLAETVPFVAISVATGAVLIEASHLGYREAGALGLHGWAFHLVTQGFYLAANVVTFIGRFVIFNFVLFADRGARPGPAGTALPPRGLPHRPWWPAPGFADRSIGRAGPPARLGQQRVQEAARFGAVGLLGLAVTGGGANLLRYEAGMGRLSSLAVATVLATGVTFAGSRYWTYRHRERSGVRREAAVFFAVNGIGVAISEVPVGLTYPLHLNDGLSYNVALIGGIGLATLFRFWSYHRWVWPAGAVASAGGAPPAPADLHSAGRVGTVRETGLVRRLWRLAPEFARFSVIGACAWLVTDAVFNVLRVEGGAGPQTAGLAAIAVATAVSFTGNRYWTFRHRTRTTVPREGLRYLLLTGAGLVIQLAWMKLTIGALSRGGLPYWLAPATALGFTGLFRYWSCRTWVWRGTWSNSRHTGQIVSQ